MTASTVACNQMGEEKAGTERAELEVQLGQVRPLVYRWAMLRTGDPDDAEDVTQRVLLNAYTRIETFEGRSRFTTWLYRVTMNAAAELRRQRGFMARLRENWSRWVDANPSYSADEGARLDREAAARTVEALMMRLPVAQRCAFDLVDLQGFAAAEAAEMLGLKAATLRVNLMRARRTIRRQLLESWQEAE